MNIWTGVGRLGRDAELRYTAGGVAVSNFSIAVDRPKKGGEKQKPLWLKVTLWGKIAEVLTKYLTKGKQVAVSGELDIREWQDREGAARTSTEINARNVTLLGGGTQQDDAPADSPSAPESPEPADEDIPF